jgi:hypothetical protein
VPADGACCGAVSAVAGGVDLGGPDEELLGAPEVEFVVAPVAEPVVGDVAEV